MHRGGSFRSDSSGYVTAEEEMPPERERSVQFASTVQEMTYEDRIDRKSYRPYFKRPKLGQGIPAKIFRKYPRTYACTCGIIIPVWILVLLALLCGKFLGELESGGELDDNDAAMRRRTVLDTYQDAVSDTLNSLPTVCFMLYKNGTLESDLDDSFRDILDDYESFDEWIDSQPNLTGNTIVNVSKFAPFMDTCGISANNYTQSIERNYFKGLTVNLQGDTSLSFNWNRCMRGTAGNRSEIHTSNRIFIPSTPQVIASHPDNQEQAFVDEWTEHFDALHEKYLPEYLAADPNGTVKDSRFQAFNRSLFEATGRTTCTVNIASAGWFWFTIMTTVGYGNQAPLSVGGRAMCFTAGFVCILLFGAVLATTGTIISHIVFDVVYRLKMKILLKKQVMMLIWGLLWCTWMIGMSYFFIDWYDRRLGEQVTWQDAYWFSYISTTTVGLGDYYQVPQVLFISDLLAFSLSYLFGFVLLSTFLAELGQLLAQNLPDLSVELGKRLQHVGITETPGPIEGLDGSRQAIDQSNSNDEFQDALPETSPEMQGINDSFKKDNGHYGVEDTA